jgi:hypothetical protein
MAKRRTKDEDSIGMQVARGLSTLAVGMKFNLAEAGDVQSAFAEIVRVIELGNELEQRVAALEREKAATRPKLRAAS